MAAQAAIHDEEGEIGSLCGDRTRVRPTNLGNWPGHRLGAAAIVCGRQFGRARGGHGLK